jgi:hypothetical protein
MLSQALGGSCTDVGALLVVLLVNPLAHMPLGQALAAAEHCRTDGYRYITHALLPFSHATVACNDINATSGSTAHRHSHHL